MIGIKEQAQAIMMNKLRNGKTELTNVDVEFTIQKLQKNELTAEQEDFLLESELEQMREKRENGR